MRRERLEKLVELLERPLPKHTKFDLRTWKIRMEFGTACCAVGLAMSDPWFNEEGLTSEKEPIEDIDWFIPVVAHDGLLSPGQEGVRVFFGIGEEDFHHLFLPATYPRGVTPQDVADRIREFMVGEHVPTLV